MYSFALMVVFLCCGCISAYEERNGKIRIDLVRQKTAREQQLNSPNLEKYGINFDWMKKRHSAPPRTNDSIALYRYLDNEFYGKIVIGHPGQTMNVAFDTAWGLSWVLSSKCETLKTIGCLYHNKYDHSRSSYYKKNGTAYIGNEGTFNFTGFYSYENISIAHSNVTGFSFVEMVSVPSSFIFNKADGVLGLALQDSGGMYEPFFYTLLRQGKIKQPIFSIYLNRDPSSNRGGNVMLGFYDPKHIHQTHYPNNSIIPDEIKYLPIVDGAQYWEFAVDRIIVTNDKNNNMTLCDSGCKAISDTSSNEIIGPADDIAKIHDLINAKKFYDKWVVPCSSINKLPKVDIVLDGQYFRMTGKQYIVKMSYLSFTVCLSAFSPNSSPSVNDLWVLGGAFLSQYYSIYNVQEKKIGFVRAA